MQRILGASSTRKLALSSTAVVAISLAFASAASADCLPSASGLTVTCTTADPDGYDGSAVDGLTINVTNGATVGTGAATSTLLQTGASSAVNNEGAIDAGAGNGAVSLGGGGTFTDAVTATGTITGDITLGTPGDGQVNTFNNFNVAHGIFGDVTSNGSTNFTNKGGLTGDVTITGSTTNTIINDGTLTGDLTADGANTLTNTGTITGDITLGTGDDTIDNTGTITGNIDLGAGNNTFGASGTAQLPSGSLTADPSGTNTLNLYGTGAATLNIPVTNFSVLNKYGTGSWALTQPVSFSQGINVSEGTLITPDADFLGSNTIVNTAGPFGTGGVTFTNAAGGTYSGNMSDTYNPADDTGSKGTVTIGGGGTAVTVFSGTNTYQGGTYITQGTLQVQNGAALADNGDVYIGGAGGILDVANAETIGGLFDGTTANGQVTLSGGNLIINNGAFSGVISGANGIEKIGTGSLTLSGTNTFTGAATVTDGTLILSGGNAIGNTTAVVVNASDVTSGTLQVNTAETIGNLSGNGGQVVLNAGLTTGDATNTTYSGVISGTGSLTKVGAGTFSIWGANTYSGGTTVSAGILEGNSTSLQGNISVAGGSTLLFTQDSDGTYAGNITGAGTVTKASGGNLTLSGTNTGHSGTTNLNGGTISIGAATNIGTGTLAFDGGTLETTGALTLANAITLGNTNGGGTVQTDADTTLSGVISGPGHLTKSGGANLTLTAANTYSGGTTISGGTLTGTTTTIQGDIEDNAALVFTNGGTYAGNLTGNGSVTLTTGTMNFTGNNDGFSGATLINGGTLVANGHSIGDTSAVTVATGANLNLTVVGETIGSLSGGGNVDLGGFALTTGGDGTSSTFDGVLSNGGLVVAGPGSLTLTNAGNLLPGGLTVSGGGLNIATGGQVDTGAGDTTVSGGALTVDGTLLTTNAHLTGGATTVNGVLTATAIDLAGTLNVAAAGNVNGPVTSSSGAIINVDGNITGDVANGVGATINGTGHINGALTNDGTLSPGHSPGIINVNGSFAQSATGTLSVDLTPTATAGTGYDQVLVTGTPGTATLAGTLALHPTTNVLYTNGATYDVVLADGGVTGNFSTITGNVISPFISFTSGIVTTSGAQQAYRLTVARTTYAAGMGAGADPNEIAAANGFQGLIPGATGDAAALIINFDNSSAAEVQSFFHQATPEAYGAYATAIQDQGELFTRQVALRLHETGTLPNGSSVWARGYGNWGNGDDKSYRFGSDQDIAGFAAGVDFTAGDLVLGGAAGWSKDNIDYNLGNSSGESKSWQIGGYGNYNVGAINADLQLSYIKGDFDANKSIVTATINRMTDADFDGHLFKAVGTVGYNTDISEISIRPFLGFDYSSGNVDSFTETGADAANLTVASIDADKADLLVGLDVTPNMGKLSPYGRATFRYEVGNDDRNISAIYNGNAATAFTVSGVAPGRAEFDLDAGLSYAVTDAASIFAGYQGTIRNDLNHHGVSGGIRFSF